MGVDGLDGAGCLSFSDVTLLGYVHIVRSMMRRDGGAELSLVLQSEQPDITFLQATNQ